MGERRERAREFNERVELGERETRKRGRVT